MPLVSGGGGGSSGALTLLSTVTLSSPGVLDATGLAQTYNDLIIEYITRGTSAVTYTALVLTMNNDTTAANYASSDIFNNIATPSAFAVEATRQIAQSIPDSSATANRFGMGTIVIGGYTSTSWHKTATGWWGADADDTNAPRAGVNAVQWKSTAAVTEVTLQGLNAVNLATGSTMRIYGRL